jgi:hypothetical protein
MASRWSCARMQVRKSRTYAVELVAILSVDVDGDDIES